MSSQPEMNVITKSRNECPVVQVTVYKDRAQVSRTLEVELTEGIQELHITDFVEIEEDSIRVEGKGNATIAEVSFQSELGKETDVTVQERDGALVEELKQLTKERDDLKIQAKKEVIGKEKKLLDDFFSKAARSGIAPVNPEESSTSNVELSGSYLRGVRKYITEYRTMNYALIADLQELEKKEDELSKAIEVAQGKLADLRGGRKPTDRKRECIIVLESPQESKIQITVSYVVFSASWIPSYDLRMFTDKGNLKLFYYGLISQSSGEDWNDTKIFLSTAEPSCGGSIPRIPITHLSVYEPPRRIMSKSSGFGSFRRAKSNAQPELCLMSYALDDAPMMDYDGAVERMRDLDVVEVKVVDKTTSTSYEIARNSTIPSDNNPHKVTVAILDYSPELSYVTVPKASPNAFLRAKVVNTSAFMLLAGESSIFLDNSFIAKAQLQSAAPKEEFTCSLGVDPSVRVTYKPIIKMKSSSGIISKSEANLYEQAIAVKNLHDYPVKVLVQDSLPKSTRDKIKVNLISPIIDAKHPEKSAEVRMTTYNVVEWDLNIASMTTKEVVLKYSIEHPANMRVESTAAFATQDAGM